MIERDKIPLRSGYYWARVSLGFKNATEIQPVELDWVKGEPRVFILACEANAIDYIVEFIAPLDPPKERQ